MEKTPNAKHVVIVGDGLAACVQLRALVERLERQGNETPVTIEVIGAAPREKFWRGLLVATNREAGSEKHKTEGRQGEGR